jgi:hypothetical protein
LIVNERLTSSRYWGKANVEGWMLDMDFMEEGIYTLGKLGRSEALKEVETV